MKLKWLKKVCHDRLCFHGQPLILVFSRRCSTQDIILIYIQAARQLNLTRDQYGEEDIYRFQWEDEANVYERLHGRTFHVKACRCDLFGVFCSATECETQLSV